MLDSGVGPFVAHALEECIAEHTVRLCRSVKISDACVEALRLVSLAAIAAPRMPSIMAVKVFLVKPSIRSGRLESTYTIRGKTRTASKPASTIRG